MSLGLYGCGYRQCWSQYSEGVKLVCILAPVWSSLCWLSLSAVEWVGVSRARSQPCTRRFPFHFVHINREGEAGQKRETGRGSGEGRREQQRPRERNRGETRRGEKGTEWWRLRQMNEIFILDPEETRLLFLSSHFFTSHFILFFMILLPLLFLLYFIFSRILLSAVLACFSHSLPAYLSPSSFPVCISIHSETTPLVEVRQLFLSICPVFLFVSLCLWKKNRKLQPNSFVYACYLPPNLF